MTITRDNNKKDVMYTRQSLDKDLLALSKLPLTQTILKQLIQYFPNTGEVYWLGRIHHSIDITRPITSMSNAGYYRLSINGKRYLLHRLVFLYMLGVLPDRHIEIDHINGIRSDNRWSNLRVATKSENMCNVPLLPTNTTGVKGICWVENKVRKHYVVQIIKDSVKVTKYFSVAKYKTKEAAFEAATIFVRDTRNTLHKEYANHGDS